MCLGIFAHFGIMMSNQVRERLATMKKEAEAAEEGREETEERAEVIIFLPRFVLAFMHHSDIKVVANLEKALQERQKLEVLFVEKKQCLLTSHCQMPTN